MGQHDALYDLHRYECKVYSQNGEDGVIRAILDSIGETNRFCVEFGVGDGTECNTRLLVEQSWNWLWMDCAPPETDSRIHKEWVNAETIVPLFNKYRVPQQPDVLSLDTDFNDLYILAAVLRGGFRPRVLVVEYNAMCGPTEILAVRYDPQGQWTGTDYFGASLAAFVALSQLYEYRLVYCESNGSNAFFVPTMFLDATRTGSTAEIWRPQAYRPFPADRVSEMAIWNRET